MVVLALETVTPAGSYAVSGPRGVVGRRGESSVPHAVRLPTVLLDVLREADYALDDVSRVAVIAGPGSFTGVRIGLAAAQGLAQTRGWEIALVPTLVALAWGWHACHATEAGPVVACLDGARGEVFWQTFDATPEGVVARAEASVSVPQDVDLLPGTWLVGDGAVRYEDLWRARGGHPCPPAEPMAVTAARLGARIDWPTVRPHDVQPLYVRPPDVELARARRAAAAAGSESTRP
jgi:tRNA threonylcarbamoyladenosine biosynthesis protein TsaB